MLTQDEAPSGGGRRPLIGREVDVQAVTASVRRGFDHGSALLITGEAGVGKTALLDRVVSDMTDGTLGVSLDTAAGVGLVRAAGVEFETDVSYAALNQLLLPLREAMSGVHSPARAALAVALGLEQGPSSDRLLVATAALTLLRQAAEHRPLLVVVDDVAWLDRASAVVFGFVARRLGGSQVALLAATRTEDETFFERAGLSTYDLAPLAASAAARLLDRYHPGLPQRVRDQVLATSQGSPLALHELAATVQDIPSGTLPDVLPLSRRLSSLFEMRVRRLPDATRDLLVLAALEGTGDLRLLQATHAHGRGLDDLAPAEQDRIVEVPHGGGRLAFRHPLIRSAVVQMATSEQRRRAHQALADQLTDQPERRAWHLAKAAIDVDERTAELLEQVAHRILQRGDGAGAVSALVRSADLSEDHQGRQRRLATAAYVGAGITGASGHASELLDQAAAEAPDSAGALYAAIATVHLLLSRDGDLTTAHRLLVGILEASGRSAEPELDQPDEPMTMALSTLLLLCWFGGRRELWRPFDAALNRLGPSGHADLVLLAQTYADPVRTAAAALDRVDAAVATLAREPDHFRILRISSTALYTDRLAACRNPLWRVVDDGRGGGALTPAVTALAHLIIDDLMSGRWDEAEQLADEAAAMCEAGDLPLQAWIVRHRQAVIAALRGHEDVVDERIEQMRSWAVPRGIKHADVCAHHARALAAAGRQDFERAYRHASAISPPGTLVSHVPYALWVLMDLVEAAVRTGRPKEAQAHVEAMRAADLAAVSSRLALVTAGCAAVAGGGNQADRLFEQALDTPHAEQWPFDAARIHLAYGEWLRRARRIGEARVHVTAALTTFESLTATPWVQRAVIELRATGIVDLSPQGPTSVTGTAALTAQELEIASLAARGLTNKQIGQRLYLSHRTVSAHLYRIFPKLGITTRAALRDALDAAPPKGTSSTHD